MATKYSSPLLSRSGAAEILDTDGVDAAGVAWHYGNPLVEQAALAESPIVVDRSHRAVLKVSGPDAAEFLNNLFSQKLIDLPPTYSASALDLDAQGRILHAMDVTKVDDDFYLDLPLTQAESLEAFMSRMVFWSQVEITATDLAILTVLGPWEGEIEATFVRRKAFGSRARTDIAVPHALIDATVTALESLGVRLAGLMAYTAERVKALEPELAADLDDKSIPHEVPNWIGDESHHGAVHLFKGCYRGQETVSRVHNLGRSPRVLVMMHLDGSAPELPHSGDPITVGGRKVGRLGTIVHDCNYGPIALALVKRSALDASEFQSGDVALAIDADSIPQDDGERPGKSAINKLRGL